MRKQRPEGMNDKMYRPEYDGPKVPPKGEGIPMTKPYPMPTIRPDKPGRPVRPPMMVKPPRPGSKPYPMPQIKDDMGMKDAAIKEEARKTALQMVRKRSGK